MHVKQCRFEEQRLEKGLFQGFVRALAWFIDEKSILSLKLKY